MPVIELVDETYVVAAPGAVAAIVHDPARWKQWWPDLVLTPFMDRDQLGIRWSATGSAWQGSIELWLEPVGDGVVLHHYQRLDPVGGGLSPHRVAQERARRARSWKQHVFRLKDDLEAGRRPGTPRHPDGSRSVADVPRMGG